MDVCFGAMAILAIYPFHKTKGFNVLEYLECLSYYLY